ncbi:uncharacterized protein LOC115443638 [Manduca sexta]|uniref:MADF domain-containing protein n=1 Tax=Manduca sexta TaxID=7130 RepID=A0A921Z2M1_MANSE|nr:uncharacterized protein LOC115443638 [Manduca sexta]KAG6450345.1 hypothetical protein O3G_MSEX006524 [Manduca sexta]KAG6450346.1 hypothetical protein O3G_MSEX006524 [Manduca sexta]
MKDDLNFLIEFIKEVESHPCLYDCGNIDYVNKHATETAWAEIAKKLHESAIDCKTKWRSTRSSYIRSLHPTKDGPKKEYYLAPYLAFLNPFIRFRYDEDAINSSPNQPIEVYISDGQIEANLKHEEDEEETETENINGSKIPHNQYLNTRKETTHRKKIAKLKRNSNKHCMNEADNSHVENVTESIESDLNNGDSYELYVKSLLPHLRSMTERQYFAFQRGVIDLIENIKYSDTSKS